MLQRLRIKALRTSSLKRLQRQYGGQKYLEKPSWSYPAPIPGPRECGGVVYMVAVTKYHKLGV